MKRQGNVKFIHGSSLYQQIAEEGEPPKDIQECLITTGFIEWCARHLAEPSASNEDIEPSASRNHNETTELALEFEVN